ncbi:S8 family serine peptidase [Kribbella sp. HUAS MG21]|uniref:S8 family serine peptidase n=1 Tax=Kribbella sp. HUAS MG21 TaxID=3160966 RepID=A0AAU7T771_9ACTN
MSFRPAQLLRLALPAALVAGSLIVLTGSSGTAAQPKPYHPKFNGHRSAAAEYEPNAVLVKFKPKATSSARRSAVTRAGASVADTAGANVVKLEGDVPAPELLKKVKADPAVELASLNYKRHLSATPNDEYYASDQRASYSTVRLPEAWDVSKSTGSQLVAVLDTGVDAGHPDLVGHLVPGYNAVSSTRPNPVDDNGHGTMTLGLIAAGANNGVGVAGVGWNVKAMPVKVLDANGGGYDADIAEGIDWAVAHGAKVINMSLGGPGDNVVLHDAVKRAYAKGVVIVVAAGNDGSDVVQYPAAYPEAIAVAATNPGGALTSFSSYGDWVDVAAPGWNLLSTGPRALTPPEYVPYWYCTGTSCSAPVVTGIAALVKNKWPTLTPAQVAQRLKVLARDAGPRGIDPYFGYGIVDAYAALGGRWAADFATNAPDGNDEPSRALLLKTGYAVTKISTEGEVDWYRYEATTADKLRVIAQGSEFHCSYASNFAPRVDVYDSNLRSLGHAVKPYPTTPIDPETGCHEPEFLAATLDVPMTGPVLYVAVRNDNGSRDTRDYTLSIQPTSSLVMATPGSDYPVRDVQPAGSSSTAAVTVHPSVTFARDVDDVSASTVRLVNGKTGSTVGATVAYDAASRKAVISPTVPLLDGTPYRIVVNGVREAGGAALAPYSSVFSTADVAPRAVSLDASGLYLAANLAWKLPPMSDLDQVIVRRNVGSRAPTLSTGTLVYAGTGTAVKNTGLAQGTTYTYAAWVKDRSGKLSPVATTQLLGMRSGIAVTSTLVSYGGSITVRGSTLRIDGKAYAGLPVNVYVRPKTSSRFSLLAALKTSSTGTVSVAHKPLVSSVYMLTFPGNADLMGTRTVDVTVQVRPTISAALSPSSIRLGGTTALSGYVAPAHAGKLVYLQQYGNKVWRSIASVKLSTSGKYAFGIRPAVRGQIAYRAWFPGDADHAPAYSPHRIVTIS